MRLIIEDARFKPLDSDYKVIIIDECHAISNAGWQALLKLLEEPPKTTIFILCTTNPEKIPATILSRVQRYDFQKISQKGIVERLLYILCEEDKLRDENNRITNTMEALEYISKVAERTE